MFLALLTNTGNGVNVLTVLLPSEAIRSRSWASSRLCRSSNSSSRALHHQSL